MKSALKSGQFWAGVVAGVILLAFVPALNPRTVLGRPKKA